MGGTNERFHFSAVPGFFVDYAEMVAKDAQFRVTTLPQFGLIDREYETDAANLTLDTNDAKPWERLERYVRYLNTQTPESTRYKILYIARHGFGYHNYQEAKVGTEAWDNYWSRLDGDGQIVWADSQLHEDGIEQGKALGRFWSNAVSHEGIPLPGTIYTSPLARCLETTRLAYAKVFEGQKTPFRPIVKEFLRETIIDHACDRRSKRSWIEEHYPAYVIEPGFSEDDKLWESRQWETLADHVARKQRVLEEIFTTDENAFVALTMHSGAISAFLGALNHPEFRLREGTSFAMLVRADAVKHDE